VSAFEVTHRGPDCFGFVFQEKNRRPFLSEKAEALGVPFGPERKRLVAGESLTLADGRVVTPDDVLGAEVHGTKFVWIGDVARTDNLLPHVRDADALAIEATFIESEREEAQRYGHITAAQAATLARDGCVRQLFLHHISRRYHPKQVEDEARTIFPNAIVVSDFDQFTVNRVEG
jgi:ribonuclease Z